ncbi:MAG TPA: RES family NAD+ phosphorylase [Steroidobacteraceae bacterium]|nr:RES family NAD+ phosphorylase [Steroidobacteraceae bacterium]
MTTWTPHALESNARRYEHELWRVVESQHTASTMRLVDSLAEQALLESILEESKPELPAGTEKLHYLLATPFRYHPHTGSRFRAPFDAGVWYGAEQLRTALAEKSFWRMRFLLDSPGTPDLLKPVPHTAFRAGVKAAKAVDLTEPPFARDRAAWTHRTSYEATQAFGVLARKSAVDLIRYESVRDTQHAACAAVLAPAAFKRTRPGTQQTWFIAASRTSVRCVKDEREGPTWEFTAEQLT